MTRTWTRDDFRRWTDALTLVSEDWLAPLLPELGVRGALAEQQNLFKLLSAEAAKTATTFNGEFDPAITATVGSSLRRVAASTSIEDAQAFQRWTRRHFVCRDAPVALYAWRQVLRRLLQGPGGLYRRVEPPGDVAGALTSGAALVSDPELSESESAILRAAPPPNAEDIELGLDQSSTALTATEIVRGEATVAALALLARELDPERIRMASSWATSQAEALDLPADQLGAARFLSVEPQCADAPAAILLDGSRIQNSRRRPRIE